MSVKIEIPVWVRVKGKLEDEDSEDGWLEGRLLLSNGEPEEASVLGCELSPEGGSIAFTVHRDDLEHALANL